MPRVVMFRTWVSPRSNSPEPCARAVDPLGVLDHPLADQLLGQAPEGGRGLLLAAGQGLAELGGRGLGGLGLELVQAGLPLGLVGDGDRLADLGLDRAPDGPGHVLAVLGEQRVLLGLGAGLADQLDLERAGGGDVRLGQLEGEPEGLLGRLGGAGLLHQPDGVLGRLGLDHEDIDPAGLVLAAGHDHVEGALLELGVGGVDDPVALLAAEPDGPDRARERDPGQLHGRRGAVDGQDVRQVLHVGRQDGGDHVDLVAQALGERRPQRPVDQPGGEDGRLGRPALTTEEAAGDLAGGVHALLDVDGQGHEVELLFGMLGRGGGDQQLGLAEADEHGAARLAGQLAGLQIEVTAADGALHTMNCHKVGSLPLPLPLRPLARRLHAPAAVAARAVCAGRGAGGRGASSQSKGLGACAHRAHH
jgi:hypothetical protein